MERDSKIIRSVALYRVLAMLLVIYGHLASVATFSTELPNIVVSAQLPILSNSALTSVDLLLCKINTNGGTLGVVMFFIASGYLMSKMMDRYSRREFLVNRTISSFPTLWICLIIDAIFVGQQGVTFTSADYLASAFPFIPFPVGQFMVLVLWTLRIEMKFYIWVTLLYGRKKQLIFYGYVLVLFLTLVYQEFPIPWLYWQLYDTFYFPFLFLGVLIEHEWREHEQQQEPFQFNAIAMCVLLNLLLFKLTDYFTGQTKDFYSSCASQVFPILLFLLLLKLEHWRPRAFEYIPSLIYSIGKLVYPIYLIHVPCGLTIMYQLSLAGWENPYAICLCGVAVSFAVAGLVYLVVTKPSGMLMKRAVAAMRERRRSEDV